MNLPPRDLNLRYFLVSALTILFLAACQGEEATSTPTIEISSPSPTAETISPTLSPTATAAEPTAAATQTREEPPTATIEPTRPLPTVTSPVPTPTSSPEPAPTPQPIPQPTFYEIQAGDSLIAVADQFGVSPEALAIANGYTSTEGFSLIVGQEIQIPLCQAHQIVLGNTLSDIAAICGLFLDDLVTANIDPLARLENLAAVPEGLVLRIPQESGTPDDLDCILQAERQQVIEYTPQPGEGLFCLSQKFNVSTTAIIQANIDRLVAPNIYGETPLLIPPLDGAVYVVTSADVDNSITLEMLAEWYQIQVDAIFDWNGNPVADPLSQGDQLYLPGANLDGGLFRSEPAAQEEAGEGS